MKIFSAQSWFETEKQSIETENAAAEDLFAETLQPSVPTGSDEDSCCQVCREAFEQFYNDEKEEWHLRPAVSYEDKNFHPLCLEDHKVSKKQNPFTTYCLWNIALTFTPVFFPISLKGKTTCGTWVFLKDYWLDCLYVFMHELAHRYILKKTVEHE